MKNINVKKVVAGAAALGVGALMVSGAFAANVTPPDWTSVTKEDLFNNGVPAVNVVVGSLAQPVDVVWAGNIAAAIGSKAYTTVEGSEGGYVFNGVTVEVGSQGTSTISGDGKLIDDFKIGTPNDDTLDDDDYSLLQDNDVDADDDSTYGAYADELTIKDTLQVTSEIKFDTDKDVADLTATIHKNDIIYTIDLDEGLRGAYDDSKLSKELKFKVMGDEYTVDTYNGTKLTLVKNKSTQTYAVGDIFVPEEGYTIEVTQILDNGSSDDPYEAELVLKDAEGNVLDTDVFQTDDDDIFDQYLDAALEVDAVYSTQVKIISGSSSKLELEDGKYIKDFPNKDDELWKATFNPGSDTALTEITIKNADSDLDFKDEDALKAGDKIELPNDFADIEFVGLTEEDSKEFSIEDGVITYKDASDNDQELFIYEQDISSDIDEYTTDGYINDDQLYFTFFNIDSSNLGVKVQQNDDDGDYLDSSNSWTNEDCNYATDWHAGWNNLTLESQENSAVEFHYLVYVDGNTIEDNDAFAMGLEVGLDYNIEGSTTKWTVNAIDTDLTTEDDDFDTTSHAAGYINDTTFADDDMEAGVQIQLTDPNNQDINVNVDAYTGELVDTENNDYKGTNYQVTASGNINLGIHDSDDLTFGYTTYGTFFEIDNGVFNAVLPEKQLYGQLFVGGGTSTTTTLNGATLTLTTEGEVVSDEDETISAKLVSKDIEATGANGPAMIPAEWNPANLVVLDNQTTANPKVVVGGYMVNLLAQNMGLEEVVTTSGDYVVGKNAEGNIIVAGMEANDTAAAAQELIAAIEAM